MRSVIIIGPAHPYRGGIASFTERLAQEFIQQGWQVEVINFTLQYPKFLFPGKDQYHDGAAPDNIKITRKINTINPLSWAPTRRYINKQKPDLVIAQFWMAYVSFSIGTILSGVKTTTLSIVHNVYPHERKPGDGAMINSYMRRSDKFLALSKKVEKDLLNFTDAKNITRSPHPVYDIYGSIVNRETALMELGLNPQKKYILFFGLIRAYKGLDLLLTAFANVAPSLKDVELIIAGEFYEDRQKYLAQIVDLEIKEKVHLFDHFIPNNQVHLYFSSCDLVAQTYHRATQSGIMQIAIEFEKPILVTNVGGLGEMIEDGKHGYVCEKDTKEIGDCMVEHFKNPEGKFTKALQDLKKEYSWDTFYQNIVTLTS